MEHLIEKISAGAELMPIECSFSVKELCSADDLEMYESESFPFTAREKEVLSRFRSVKRKREWVTGRIAAKEAFLNYTGLFCEILAGDQGEPVVVSSNDTDIRGVSLSISHSGGVAAAVVSCEKIGFDLESVEKRPNSFLNFYYTGDEKEFLSKSKDCDESVTSLWTAKEAVSKLLGKGGQLNFKTIETHRESALIAGEPSGISLYRHIDREFCFTLAYRKNDEVN